MKASIKAIDIDPPVGIRMGGFSERERGCTGIHDHIYASILAVEDKGEAAVLVCCDVIGLDRVGVNKVRDEVCGQRRILPQNIMLSATHTHSSVAASRINGATFIKDEEFGEQEADYYNMMLQKIAGGVIQAIDDMEPATIGYGKGSLPGYCTNRNDPDAYCDTTVSVIKLARPDGSPLGIVTHFACHPTILNHTNYLITSDFPGFFRQRVKEIAGCPSIYIQGTAGSTSTRFTKKESTFMEAQRMGNALAEEAVRVAEGIAVSDELDIRGALREVVLAVKEFPTDADCLAEIEHCKDNLESLQTGGAAPQLVRKAYVTLQGAERNYATKKRITFTELTTEMQCIDFGAFALYSLPGDVFGEIGRDIRAGTALPNPITVGYANDFVGYIVSREGYEMHCYEKNMTILDSKAQGTLLAAAVLLEQQIKDKR